MSFKILANAIREIAWLHHLRPPQGRLLLLDPHPSFQVLKLAFICPSPLLVAKLASPPASSLLSSPAGGWETEQHTRSPNPPVFQAGLGRRKSETHLPRRLQPWWQQPSPRMRCLIAAGRYNQNAEWPAWYLLVRIWALHTETPLIWWKPYMKLFMD